MGLAISWIFLYHSKIFFPDSFLFHPMRFLVSTGFGGVDVFFFLSGFGLMRHMTTRYSSPFHFYKRRLFIIYPAYFIITSLSLIIDFFINSKTSFQDILLSLTTLGFWFGNSTLYWFIPSILSLYIVYPLFFKFYLRYQLNLILLISTITLLFSILLISNGNDHFTGFLARVPVFLIGSHISYNSFKSSAVLTKQTIACNIIALFVSFGILLTLMLTRFKVQNYGLEFYLLTLGTPPLCLLTSFLLDKVALSTLFIFSYLGTLSLEIYLVHKQIVFRLGEMLSESSLLDHYFNITLNYGHYVEYLVYFLVTIGIASLLHHITNINTLRTCIFQHIKRPLH